MIQEGTPRERERERLWLRRLVAGIYPLYILHTEVFIILFIFAQGVLCTTPTPARVQYIISRTQFIILCLYVRPTHKY